MDLHLQLDGFTKTRLLSDLGLVNAILKTCGSTFDEYLCLELREVGAFVGFQISDRIYEAMETLVADCDWLTRHEKRSLLEYASDLQSIEGLDAYYMLELFLSDTVPEFMDNDQRKLALKDMYVPADLSRITYPFLEAHMTYKYGVSDVAHIRAKWLRSIRDQLEKEIASRTK